MNEEDILDIVADKMKMYRLGVDDGFVKGLQASLGVIDRVNGSPNPILSIKEAITHLIERLEGEN